jgi:two-component system, LytTR family, response regulator
MKLPATHRNPSDTAHLPIILLPSFSGWVEVPIYNIVRLEGLGNYTVFILADGQRLTYSKTISLFESRLAFPFVRIHKSCIINLEYLRENWQRGKTELTMTDGHRVSVSRRRRSEVRQWVNSYRQTA